VLVIDDDPNARALLARFLAREGFSVRTAPDGLSGLELARSLKPRAILLDVMMPHMDGWAVLSALKSDPEVADIPVIMETIVHEKGLAFSLGAEDYLTKPIQWPRLKKVLDRFRSTPPAIALIVDDDDSTQRALDELLEKEGWSVTHARDRDAAFARLGEKRPSLLLVDLNMSHANGFALIRELRRLPEWRDVPVVALSANELSPEERSRLEGHVQQIISTEDDAPEALLNVLRGIPLSNRPRTGAAEKDHA
jgi:CheY-like chemotaxis protein